MADSKFGTLAHHASRLTESIKTLEASIAKEDAHYMDAIVRLSRDLTKLRDITEANPDPIAASVNSIAKSAIEVQREWEAWRANGFY